MSYSQKVVYQSYNQAGSQEENTFQSQQEIKAIFEEFKDLQSGCIDASEFLNILKQTGVAKNCQLLVQKLERLMSKKLREDEFNKLFNFNFEQEDNFELLFDLIDSSKSGRIGKEELMRANNLYCMMDLNNDIRVVVD